MNATAGWSIVNPEGVVETEIANGAPQGIIASTYGLALIASLKGEKVDFARMNAAIVARRPKGLQRVKEKAHRFAKRHGWAIQ